ncbi:MAG: Ig-like domain-containing protein [Bacteroidales bacterium]|nr:Ig-like domain-containing protein [Bacteroidales bacterium]
MRLKDIISKWFPAIPVSAVLAAAFFQGSCANTTQAPTGGPKDSIPPVLYDIRPLPGAVKVPVHDTKIAFTFDEYVKVKDPKSIFLSPPQQKAPKYKMKGKTLIVYFEDDLLPNTSYTLDLTNAIADNNEGNLFPGYTYVFSTGETIDSMMVSGMVQDCNTLLPVKGATVMLYKDHSDSAVFLSRPYAAVKTDEWGFFSIRNIQDTVYRMYALKDASSNNIYDPDEDLIGFVDSLVRPTVVVNDTLPELLKYDMKDTVRVLARKTPYEISLFREKPSKQYLKNKNRIGERSAYITFNAPGANIHSLGIKGLPSDQIITQFNIPRDSLELWVNNPGVMPDTLYLEINYDKTDSLGVLSPFDETVPLYIEGAPRRSAYSKSSRRNLKHEDTICVATLQATSETFEHDGFSLEFKYPPINGDFNSIVFRSVNPRQQESRGTFTVERDSTNLRRYVLRPEGEFMTGYDYYMKVPANTFRDINGFWNDSTEVKVNVPTDEKLSSINLNLTGVREKYIVELLDEARKNTLMKYVVDGDRTLKFPYLKKGKYCIRITEDRNRNGIVDTGSLLDGRMPEKVKFYKVGDNFLINVPERMEIDQNVDIGELFDN